MKINNYRHYIPIVSMSLSALLGGCNYNSNTEEAAQNNYEDSQRITCEVIDDSLSETDSTTIEGKVLKFGQHKEQYGPRHRDPILVKQAKEARQRIKARESLSDWEKDDLRDKEKQERQIKYDEWLDAQPDSVRFRYRAVQEVNSMTFHPDFRYGGTGQPGTYGRWVEKIGHKQSVIQPLTVL